MTASQRLPTRTSDAVRDVLVTGANRSGTTWVGAMLCHSRQLSTVFEPFNPSLWPRWTPQRLPHRNLYIGPQNAAAYDAPLARVLARRRPLRAQVGDVRSPRDAGRLARDAALRATRNRRRATLVKDPIAVFSAPWLAQRFDLNVVLTVRNPGAYSSSLKRLGWTFDFANLLDQDLLMRDLLAPFRSEVVAMVDHPRDLIDQSVLLWRIHHHVIDRFRSEHPDWLCVRWEDLAAAPVEGFARLYESLGLRFDARAQVAIARDNDAANLSEVAARDTGTVRRDSRGAAVAWKRRLTEDEYARIRDGIGDDALPFYRPEEWLLS